MPTNLRAIVTAQIDATYKNIVDLGTAVDAFQKISKLELNEGTATNGADRMFHDQRTIAASGTEDLDLAGVLVNEFGAVTTFVELRALLITAAAGNTNNVRVTRPAANGVPLFLAASDGLDIPPGGAFLWACGADGKVTITAATGDLITVANSGAGTPVTYDVVIIGTSA